jgi:uncharacterized protein YceK
LKKLIPVLALTALTGGCASIVSDDDSTTYIETIPEKARCELHGQDFTRVVNTPTSLSLPSNAAPITVACKTEGYRNTIKELDTSIDGWILGNLIFGGIIGVAIDAARGAGMKYPPRITIILEPESFPSAKARDDWFGIRRAEITKRFDEAVKSAKYSCDSQGPATRDCSDDIEKIETLRAEELRKLEERRQRAGISG